MSSNREQLRDIFDRARRLTKPERAAFLDGLSAVDGVMRGQIEDMLSALDEAGPFLSEPTQAHHDSVPTADSAAAVTRPAPLRESPGTLIGPYKLLQLIGEGGFGSVFMAEQEKPVARKIALKIIKLGMDTRQVVARFEQERQALAMMDHPNIARVFDAGATETGRPYFVMELVKGDPIVEYCDKNNLSIHDRLELFAQVCNAVQHAHTKGIIHRDIKPSNILVSTQDGRPSAKVIDFGIAKATASKLTEKTLFTEHKALIGTPEYMSPEQAEGNLDIDTRTDVYSLGVLLYELLTGTTPFSSKELRSAAYAEIQRIIREVEPPKPSTRLSSNTDTIASVAAQRRSEPRKLGTVIRGELDWIVMKALEKDRQRRYETANGLAMDVRRYLSGEAVVAAPPSTAYRFKKFIRRHRVMVTAGSAVAAALLLGLIAFAWQAKVARDQRDLAVVAQQSEAEQRKAADAARAEAVAQKTEAEKQAAIAEAVAKFQTDMIAAVDPANLPKDPATGEPLKEKVTVLQAMQAAVRTLDGGSLKDQPLVEASVRETIGQTFQELARYDDAEPNLRASLALRSAALPAEHPHIAASENNLASLLLKMNQIAEAERLLREATANWRRALPAHQADLARGLDNLASLLAKQNRREEAETLMRESLALRRAALPAGHPDIGLGLNNLGAVLCRENKLGEAEPLLREAIQIRRAALPAQHPDIAASLNNLAWLLQAQKKLSEAEPLLRESLAINRAVLPAGHPTIAMAMGNLADLLRSQNKLDEAEPLLREALAIQRAALPAGHPNLAVAMNKLAALLQAQDKLSEAETLMIEGLKILRAAVPAGHPDIASDLNNLARVQQDLGKSAEARAAWDEAIPIMRKASPDGSTLLARMLWRSGSARLESKGAGGAAAALPELEEAVSMAARFLKPEDPRLKEYRETLARCKAALAE